MRALGHACVLTLLILGAGTSSAAPPFSSATQVASQRPRIVVAFANDPQQAPGRAGTTGRQYTGGGYLVGQDARQKARRVAAMYSLHEVASWPIRTLSVHCVVYEITNGRPVAAVLAELSKDSRVALAQPLQEFHTLSDAPQAASTQGAAAPYNDPLYDLQTNLVSLDIAAAHVRTQGSGVRIALIDTGVDTKHPDLRGRISGVQSFLTSRADSPRAYRHGTAMAGVMVAVANNHIGIVGIAPLAQVQVLEACWQLKPDTDEAVCNTFTLAQALAAALDAGTQIVNLSITGPADPLLSALVEAGLKRGVTFVGAAAEAADAFPTSIPGVIAVESTEHPLGSATFAAPATHVLTLRPEGQYDFESGTSVAAAEASGMIALLLSASDGRLPNSTIVALLKETSNTPTGSSSAAAAININAALARLGLDQRRGRVARSGR